MAPDKPLTIRTGAVHNACAHCPNSPPSQTRIGSAAASSTRCTASQRSRGWKRTAASAVAVSTATASRGAAWATVVSAVPVPTATASATVASAVVRSAIASATSSHQAVCGAPDPEAMTAGAAAMRASAARSGSAQADTATRRPAIRYARSIMRVSGSMATKSAVASTAGGRANPTEKSIVLPSRTTRSDAASTSENVPRAGSRSPRGLSIATTGARSAASSAVILGPARLRFRHGPVRTTGRFARAILPATSSATGPGSARGRRASSAAPTRCVSPAVAFSTSNGNTTCTGPGRPECARAMAAATSCPSRSMRKGRRAVLTRGRVRSICGISWNAPLPSAATGESPLSSRTGLSECRAEKRAERALPNPGPAVTSATPTSPVIWAQASAMCTAALSWRTCTMEMPVSMHAS